MRDQHEPTVLFNAMINPTIPYAIRGAIWYQGESIVDGSNGITLYPHVMETLVKTWRKLRGAGEVELTLRSSDLMRMTWWTTVLGPRTGLRSGTATLVRQRGR